jgi:branched-chain amino acid transport system substrate-binding protein
MKLLKKFFAASSILLMLSFCAREIFAYQIPEENGSVKIGFLIPDNKSLAAKNGAEMAIKEANMTGGFYGRSFELMTRSMEGPWGTGSKQAVSLVFEEKVWALVGSHDGRNAHLVEQAAAKVRIAFLSAWTSDPTLAQAFVPWYFSVVPNDLQQADKLIEEIYNRRKIAKVATVSDNSYDSKMAIKSFVYKTKTAGKTDPVQFFYDNANQDLNAIADQINDGDVGSIVLFGKPSSSIKLIQLLRSKKINQPVFGTLELLDENILSGQDIKNYENVVFVSSDHWFTKKGAAFSKEYAKIYGIPPGPVAAYAYDGMNIIIEAIRKGGSDSEKIQKILKEISFEGVTGLIQFDDKGNRKGEVSLMQIINGTRVPLGR